uniref:Uncharacterized protein n=1 Tax=Mus spicilegus TaxID=10103 RepID=A0A8C6H153_MUSSI
MPFPNQIPNHCSPTQILTPPPTRPFPLYPRTATGQTTGGIFWRKVRAEGHVVTVLDGAWLWTERSLHPLPLKQKGLEEKTRRPSSLVYRGWLGTVLLPCRITDRL